MENFYNPIHNSVVASSLKALAALCVMVYMSTLLRHSEEKFVSSIRTENEANATLVIATVENVSVRPVEMQPHCPGPHVHAILREILMDLYAKREMCTPQDIYNVEKHKIPKITSKTKKNAEPKGAMVVYIAVGLLLMSLGAAFVEVFKAKQQPTEKSKPSLNRRCSLADLTVLRHNRKELMRRDSVMDMGDHRVASKQLDRQTPLLRRSSFPASPGDFSYGYGPPQHRFQGCRSVSRKTSLIDNEGTFPIEHRHTHIRLLHRH